MGKSGFIAIVGRPNAGKSTLLNRVLDSQLSIVTPKAQTTRERTLGILTEDGNQIIFIDTPGIHRAKEGGINAFMMDEAREALEEPSAVWYLVSPGSELKHEEAVLELLAKTRSPIFILLNKIDLLRKPELERATRTVDAIQARLPGSRLRPISAKTGHAVEALLKEAWALLPDGPLYYPDAEQISDRPMRFFAAEKVREQLLLQLGEELPYSCAVEIEKYEAPEHRKEAAATKWNAPLTRIEAVIHVERESQKGMVIGKGGAKIKSIGQAARGEIERFIGGQAFLGLRVDVIRDWSRDPEALKRFGYRPSKSKRSS